DLNFYRQLVRNGFEQPTSLQPLRRWTRNPRVFIETSGLVDGASLDMVEREARAIIPVWSGGALSVDLVERGSSSHQGQAGWINVLWSTDTSRCGQSDV